MIVQFMAYLFLTMSPVELPAEPWQLGLHISSFLIDLPHDIRCILLSFLLSSCISLWKYRVYWHCFASRSCILSIFVFFIFSLVFVSLVQPNPFVAYYDGSNALTPPPSPPQLLKEPVPLVLEEMRSCLLYNRYLLLNLGESDDPGRMVSIIDSQVIVERYVEAALVDDGFHPHSILAKYREIRGFLHAPQGQLLSSQTYQSYVTQIREHGTRESVPYRRIVRAIRNYDLILS